MKRLLLAFGLLVALAQPAAAAARVQATAKNCGIATCSTLALTTASSGTGNLLVVFHWVLSSTAPSLPTDNLGQTWSTAFTDNVCCTGEAVGVFYKENTASGVTTVTSHTSTAVQSIVFVFEYSGMVTSGSFDQKAATPNNTVTSWTTSSTPTTTTANQVLIGCLGSGFDPNSLTITSPFVAVTCADGTCPSGVNRNGFDGDNMICGDQTVSATGAYAATGTMTSNASDSPGFIATFKIAAAATGPCQRTLLGVGCDDAAEEPRPPLLR